jgi:cytoskeletal protein RodZ
MPMSELGAYLERQRTERGVTLEEIEARTHIRRKYLEAIEAGDWDSLPPGVYTRGLLRNYARAVGINSAGVLRMYVKERPSEARLPEPQLISRPLIETPRVSTELVLGVSLLVIALGLFAWTITTKLLPGIGPATESAGVIVPTRPVGDEATPAARGTRTPARPGRTPNAAVAVEGVATVAPLATDTPGPTASPTLPAGVLVVDVRAASDAWLSVWTDQEKQFEGFLRTGEERRWEARTTVRLRTGNAGATEVTLNGRRLEPLGGPGAVVNRQWKLLESGDIEQSS